jgi:alpha-D-xyloside xylohydrolase
MDFNGDPAIYDIKDQWMFGPSLMACPVGYYKARNRSVYFPAQRGWYDLYTGQFVEGGQRLIVDAPFDKIPVYVPEGSIIPFGPEMEWSDQKKAELINLYVYEGRDADFQLYEDEGTNYNYERGKYATIDIHYSQATRTLTIGKRQGAFDGMLKSRRFNIVTVSKAQPRALDLDNPEGKLVTYNGKAVTVKLVLRVAERLFSPMPKGRTNVIVRPLGMDRQSVGGS